MLITNSTTARSSHISCSLQPTIIYCKYAVRNEDKNADQILQKFLFRASLLSHGSRVHHQMAGPNRNPSQLKLLRRTKMDAFRLSAEMRNAHLNAIETTKDIMVCKVKDLPKPQGKKLSLRIHKHLDSGLCVMFHTTSGCVLEVRGYDEEGKEFSYKFHYEKALKQAVAMRAVGASGDVSKLNVSVDTSGEQKSSVKIVQK